MKSLFSEIEINGSPQQVWECLTNFDRLPEWNPFMQRASGVVQQNEQIEVHLVLPDSISLTVTPTLLKVDPGRELRWLGDLWVKGLFDGEHYFQIEELADNRVRFIHGENFKGLLVPPIMALIGKNTLAGFKAMNEALKAEVEKQNT